MHQPESVRGSLLGAATCPVPEFRESFPEIWGGPVFEEIFAVFGSVGGLWGAARSCRKFRVLFRRDRKVPRAMNDDSTSLQSVTGIKNARARG